MAACRRLSWSIAGLAAAIVLGGCASGGTPTVTPTATTTTVATPVVTPAANPSPDATATEVPKPLAYGPVSVVVGVENCTIDFGTVTGGGTSVQHARNGTAQCTDTVNDPRVSGTYTARWNMDYWGSPDRTNGALVQWGTARLTATGGTWEGRATGVYSADRGDTIVFWWTGSGDYAGLTYFELITGAGPWTIQGQIFPGSPPSP